MPPKKSTTKKDKVVEKAYNANGDVLFNPSTQTEVNHEGKKYKKFASGTFSKSKVSGGNLEYEQIGFHSFKASGGYAFIVFAKKKQNGVSLKAVPYLKTQKGFYEYAGTSSCEFKAVKMSPSQFIFHAEMPVFAKIL